MTRQRLELWCDGSCWADHPIAPGGWAFVLVPRGGGVLYQDSGAQIETTTARMELTAAVQGLRYLQDWGPARVTVFSDAEYVVNMARKMHRWGDFLPYKNEDLWRELLHLDGARLHATEWQWVRGHSGHHYNHVADMEARSMMRGALSDLGWDKTRPPPRARTRLQPVAEVAR